MSPYLKALAMRNDTRFAPIKQSKQSKQSKAASTRICLQNVLTLAAHKCPPALKAHPGTSHRCTLLPMADCAHQASVDVLTRSKLDAFCLPNASTFREAKLEHSRSGCVALSKMAEVHESSCTTDTPRQLPLAHYATYPQNAMTRGHEVLYHVVH